MATVIKPKRSETGSSVPTTANLAVGEMAVNTADQKIYVRDSADNIVVVADSTAAASGISNVVEDTTPQLGGNLDLNSSDITGTGNINITGTATLSGNLTVDTNTLSVDSSNNRVGIGTASPAYQVEIENTGANALLVLDRTDGASTFIEGGATNSVFGSVSTNNVQIAYNSIPVVTIGSGGAITTSGTITYGTLNDGTTALTSTVEELNYLDGVTGITLGTANELLIVGSDGTSITSDSTLSIDTGSNYIGINQSSPEVTLHMTGEGAQTAQIRMEQYNDTADAPDVRTRRYRGTVASPAAVQAGDYLYRSNHEYWNGSSLIVGGSFAFDNTNNANRTQFAVSVTTDGTSADPNNASKTQFKIDGNDSGAITFNNAYKFPTSDGSANQVLQTNGSGTLSFATVSGGTSDVVDDTTPQLGGDLDLNSSDITGTGNIDITGGVATTTSIDVSGTDSKLNLTATNTGADHSINAASSVGALAIDVDANSEGSDARLVFNMRGSEAMRIDSSGNVGIGTNSPSETLDVDGSMALSASTTESRYIEMGTGRTGNGYAYIDLVGDATYTDYGLRLIRGNSGANTTSQLIHRGTGALEFKTTDAANIDFYTSNAFDFRMATNGDFHADGDVIAYSTTTSDVRLKSDVEPITNALSKVNQLSGYTFTRKHNGQKSAGILAHELEKVLPEAVREKELPLQQDDGEMYKVVEYDAIHGLLIEAIKELSDKVERLEARLQIEDGLGNK
jgi:hypothetical protein